MKNESTLETDFEHTTSPMSYISIMDSLQFPFVWNDIGL